MRYIEKERPPLQRDCDEMVFLLTLQGFTQLSGGILDLIADLKGIIYVVQFSRLFFCLGLGKA